jgi:multiple sugar transport system substrate-binding protein
MMKKLTVLLLALAMLICVAGCGSNSANPPASSAPSAEATEPTEAASSPDSSAEPQEDIYSWIINEDTSISGTVRFWIPFAGPQGMDAMIADFNSVYPNIEVVLNSYSNKAEGNVAVNTSIMAGEIDVLASFEIVNLMTRMENGLYMDLTDKVNDENISLIDNWGTEAYNYNDKAFVFPCGGISYYVAINKTAWDAAGLGEIPTEWTWDEYIAACEAMTQRDDSGATTVYGGSNYHVLGDLLDPVYQVKGCNRYYNEDGTSIFDSDFVANIIKRNIDAKDSGIWYPLTSYRADNYKPWFAYTEGKCASVIIPNLVRFLRDTETYPVDWITTFAPYPTEEPGQTNYMSGVNYFSFAGITQGCQDEEAAWAFLKWYSTYGSKYLTLAGHQSTWTGTKADDLVSLIFGSEEDAAKLIDVDAFKSIVGVTGNPSAYDSESTAYAEITNIWNEYVMYAFNGQMSVEDALADAADLSNEAIEKAQ